MRYYLQRLFVTVRVAGRPAGPALTGMAKPR
jgi:hypothetical protein